MSTAKSLLRRVQGWFNWSSASPSMGLDFETDAPMSPTACLPEELAEEDAHTSTADLPPIESAPDEARSLLEGNLDGEATASEIEVDFADESFTVTIERLAEAEGEDFDETDDDIVDPDTGRSGDEVDLLADTEPVVAMSPVIVEQGNREPAGLWDRLRSPFRRRNERQEQALENLDRLSGILDCMREQVETTSRRTEQAAQQLTRLPQIIETVPKAISEHTARLDAIHQKLGQLPQILDTIPQAMVQHTTRLDAIHDQLAATNDTQRKISDVLNQLPEQLKFLPEAQELQVGLLQAMTKQLVDNGQGIRGTVSTLTAVETRLNALNEVSEMQLQGIKRMSESQQDSLDELAEISRQGNKSFTLMASIALGLAGGSVILVIALGTLLLSIL